ncbi:MAG: PEP-CTERM sorting domain-containing protein [Opitutaceae bacterium]
MNKYTLTAFAFCASTSMSSAVIMSLEVSDVQTQIFGSTTDIPVGSSGSAANYDPTPVVGEFAVFDIEAVGEGGSSDYADLKVTYFSNDAGAGTQLMIAQTTNSQGLEDSSTVSILVDLNQSAGSITLQFDWYTPGSFINGAEQVGSSLLTGQINYTTFDIDYNQRVDVQEADLASYTFNGATDLSAVTVDDTISFRDGGGDASFGDPEAAVGFLTRNTIASHQITVGKQSGNGPALFMFEFRNPSEVVTFDNPDTTPVPEPTTYSLIAGVLVLCCAVSRRRIK